MQNYYRDHAREKTTYLTLIPTTKIQIFPICTPIVPQIFPTVAFTYCYHFPSTQTRAAYETHTRQIRAAKQFTS